MPYDATAEPNEFVGDTREEAINKAASFYDVSEDELKIGEPSEVFGLGARVVVVAVPKDLGGRRPPGGGGGGDRGGRDRGARARDRDRGGRGDRGGRDRDRGGRGRGEGRGGRERGDRNEVRASRDEGPQAERDEPAEPSADPVPSKGTASGAISSIGEYVLGAVELMRLGNFDLTETEEDDFLVLQLEGPAADRLGADDRAVGALQLLANQAAMRADEDPKRVVLDCEGDADQRDSLLERTADRAARRAKDTGRSVALDPMNGRDRRALHMAVREIDDVVTMSVGSGRYRQVVIVPEGAPEYEEAAAAAREAENRDS